MSSRKSTPSQAPTLYLAEPAGAYHLGPPVVVDASILAAMLFAEDREGVARSFLRARTLCAPHLLDCEMANVALKKLRREGQPADKVAKALQIYADLDIARHAVDARAVMALANRYMLSAYDAAYLWLAEAVRAPLATLDGKLAKAARIHLGELPDSSA